jgi:hypothetical protein
MLRQNRAENPFLSISTNRIHKQKRRPSQVEAALCKASFSIDFIQSTSFQSTSNHPARPDAGVSIRRTRPA